ncbi:MAG: histidine phosphatase family protein [Nitrospirae bacterium]|nr:histidine phosphatase family protein [Nitrospirota bacterium]
MENNQTKIFLIRHGEVANAVERCYNGHNDVDLSPEGLRQMEMVADRLKGEPIKAVYSSDLLRTVKGARLIAERHSLLPVSLKELRELSYGIWDGKKVDDIRRLYPEDFKARYDDILNYKIRDGETLLEMRDRVLPVLKEIIDKHRGECAAIVAHAGVNKILLLWSLNMDLKDFYRIQQDYAALNIISFYDNGSAVVELMNG